MAAVAVGRAHAGARPYAFTQGADALPTNEIELESWFGGLTFRGDAGTDWDWWLGPVAGITDRLEVGLFAIFEQPPGAPLELFELRLQTTVSFVDKGTWPVDVRLRAEYGLPVGAASHTLWFLAIGSRDFGPVNVTANLGTWVAFDLPRAGGDRSTTGFYDYSLGVSVEALRGLRLGGEIFGDATYADPDRGHFAGPAGGYGRGRFWLSGALGFGLNDASPARYGRLVLGIAF